MLVAQREAGRTFYAGRGQPIKRVIPKNEGMPKMIQDLPREIREETESLFNFLEEQSNPKKLISQLTERDYSKKHHNFNEGITNITQGMSPKDGDINNPEWYSNFFIYKNSVGSPEKAYRRESTNKREILKISQETYEHIIRLSSDHNYLQIASQIFSGKFPEFRIHEETSSHVNRVNAICNHISEYIEDPLELVLLKQGGTAHDIGKLLGGLEQLSKNGDLSNAQKEALSLHFNPNNPFIQLLAYEGNKFIAVAHHLMAKAKRNELHKKGYKIEILTPEEVVLQAYREFPLLHVPILKTRERIAVIDQFDGGLDPNRDYRNYLNNYTHMIHGIITSTSEVHRIFQKNDNRNSNILKQTMTNTIEWFLKNEQVYARLLKRCRTEHWNKFLNEQKERVKNNFHDSVSGIEEKLIEKEINWTKSSDNREYFALQSFLKNADNNDLSWFVEKNKHKVKAIPKNQTNNLNDFERNIALTNHILLQLGIFIKSKKTIHLAEKEDFILHDFADDEIRNLTTLIKTIPHNQLLALLQIINPYIEEEGRTELVYISKEMEKDLKEIFHNLIQ